MRKRLLAAVPLLAVFAVCVYFAVSGRGVSAELAFARFLNPDARKNAVMLLFTKLGETSGVIGAIALLLLIPATRGRIGLPVGLTVLASWITNTAVKTLVARARPEERLLEISSLSFPSGHAMNNAALYIGILLLAWSFCKTRAQKTALAVFCCGMPFMIGLSRVYFNVHYISDVIGGWCLGAAFALAGSAVGRRLAWRMKHGTSKGSSEI